MQTQLLFRHLFVAMSLALSINAAAQNPLVPPDRPLDAGTRNTVIEGLLKKINSVYIFPDVAKKMEQAIRARQAKKEYDAITNGREFARVLTDHLRQICHDEHLEVEYHPEGIPIDSGKPPNAEDVRQFREAGRRRNYQYRKVERLDEGVGLLQVDGFYPGEWVADTAAAAMSFLANNEAIILDLRQNHGGYPTGVVLLESYFFAEETRLSDQYNRAEDTIRQYWTYPIVPGMKLADKDLYILTSRQTFSAPEALASDMQSLKRATIVGEKTGGALGGTTAFRITDHFSASITFTRLINPVNKTNREEPGVNPDVAVPADQALLTAHLIALKKSLNRHQDDRERADSLKRTIAEKEKELATIQAKSARP